MKYIYETTDREITSLLYRLMLNPTKKNMKTIYNEIRNYCYNNNKDLNSYILDVFSEKYLESAFNGLSPIQQSRFITYFSKFYLEKGKDKDIKTKIFNLITSCITNWIKEKIEPYIFYYVELESNE